MAEMHEQSFVAGYLAAMADLNGANTMRRTQIMFYDPEAAARHRLADEGWLDRLLAIDEVDPVIPRLEWEQRPRTEPPAPKMGIVYVFADRSRDMVKIGWTEHNVEGRRIALEKAGGCSLWLLGACDGTLQDERAFHERFADDRVTGEWFRRTPEIEAWATGLVPF